MRLRILLGATCAVLLLVQFIRPEKNQSSAAGGAADFLVRHPAPPKVAAVLRSACYDCHSDSTRYPWYAEVQPLGWWLADHVKEGKRHLNLSQFGGYSAKVQARKVNAMSEQITDREMPLPSYGWVHRDARLSDEQVRAVSEWLDTLHDTMVPAE